MIYPEMLAAKEIVTAVRRPWTRQYWELFGGALILIGVKVRDNSRLVNKHLSELLNEQKLYHIVAIKRQNETVIPRGTDRIESGDIVFFTTTKMPYRRRPVACGQARPRSKESHYYGRKPYCDPYLPVPSEQYPCKSNRD